MQYTTIEQGKRLVELGLDPSTSDMWYSEKYGIQIGFAGKRKPAWSLDALLKVIPCPYQMTRGRDGAVQFKLLTVMQHETYTFDTELEVVFTMVVWLLENDLLDPIKLKNYDSQRAD